MVNFFYLFSVPINKHFFFIHRCSILGFLTYIHYINNNAGALDDVKVSKNIFFPSIYQQERQQIFHFLCTMRPTFRLKLHRWTYWRSDSTLLFPLAASSSLFKTINHIPKKEVRTIKSQRLVRGQND